jgi:putative N-acetyltransferase (TIGR04045 family)
MFDSPVPPFVPPQFGIKLASEPWERAASAALRERVFCREQNLFAATDRDDLDDIAETIVAVDYLMGMAQCVVGTVRIHPADDGAWFGSRLAIDAAYRNVYGLGRGLVYRAVTTAHARGCARFFAHVQAANVPFFARLAWRPLGDLVLHGHPHTLMEADLAAYPPCADERGVAVLTARRAS